MAETMTQKERTLACINWQPHDRVPIYSPIPFDPIAWEKGTLRSWHDSDNYRAVAPLVAEHCTFPGRYQAQGGAFARSFHMVPDHCVEVVSSETSGVRTTRTTVVHTPKGDLQTRMATDRDVTTGWCIEPLVKDKQDVERLLSVPFEPGEIDTDALAADRDAWGERGVVELSISTPLVCSSNIMLFDTFLEWCASDRATVERLIEAACERILVRLEPLLAAGAIECIWLGGSEQATPPMMSRKFYEELVVPYDGRIIEMVKSYGGLVHIHCHGLVNDVLESMMEMGADMTDPVEPPPDGDTSFVEAKERCRGRMVLMGNIELRALEFASRSEIDEMVRRAICDGGKEGMMLYPSATPLTWMSDQCRDNCIQYVESAVKYGEID